MAYISFIESFKMYTYSVVLEDQTIGQRKCLSTHFTTNRKLREGDKLDMWILDEPEEGDLLSEPHPPEIYKITSVVHPIMNARVGILVITQTESL